MVHPRQNIFPCKYFEHVIYGTAVFDSNKFAGSHHWISNDLVLLPDVEEKIDSWRIFDQKY